MRDKLTDTIRIGIVSSIDPTNATAKVIYSDRDDQVSGALPIVVPFTLKDCAYYMPSIGERVRVLYNPESPSKGCILGSFYADNREPPFGDENKTYLLFEDETLIEYDKKNHKLTIGIPASGEQSVNVMTVSDIFVECGGNVTVKATGNINVEAAGDINITARGVVNITAPSINLNG